MHVRGFLSACVLLRNGEWSEQHAIALDKQVTAGAAVDALRRLVTDH